MKRHSMILALALVATGCGIEGNGNIVSEQRATAQFDSVELSMDIDVRLEIADTNGLSVTCDSNLLSRIDTSVQGGTLEIDSNTVLGLDASGECFVTVQAPSFYRVEVRGSGDLSYDAAAPTNRFFVEVQGSGSINVAGIDSDWVDVVVDGSGSVTLSGISGDLEAETNGSGDIWARGLLVQRVDVTTRGSGDSEVFASEHVKARTRASGDITVYGQPASRDTDSNGSGRVRFK